MTVAYGPWTMPRARARAVLSKGLREMVVSGDGHRPCYSRDHGIPKSACALCLLVTIELGSRSCRTARAVRTSSQRPVLSLM